MADTTTTAPSGGEARDWVRILAPYREPDRTRSLIELGITLVPFAAIWALAASVVGASPWLAFALSVLNGGFLVRLFAIQHDCGHGAFFKSKAANTWVGRALGVLTVTPYDAWRHTHSVHHASTGNLDRRGVGDIHTMTLAEYRALGRWRQFAYRLYRHPLVVLGVFPSYVFLIENRLPVGWGGRGALFWASAMGTNAALIVVFALGIATMGLAPFLIVHLPSIVVAATIGIWLFYVQHQFEDASWDAEEAWSVHEAALHGSSHYVLPGPLRWITANIGIHHVHHLNSRIPFYRLTDVLRDHPDLAEIGRLTLRESLGCMRLRFWDETGRKLVRRDGSPAPRPAAANASGEPSRRAA
jgi:omega-6 fatty acid desaturase (delta-12 desaturase)